jgi:hypothetical protein
LLAGLVGATLTILGGFLLTVPVYMGDAE